MKPPNPFDPDQNPNFGPRPPFRGAETEAPIALGAVLRCISDIPMLELSWLWPGRIPLGKYTLFSGDPGLGKSLCTLDIAARVSRGLSWPDGEMNDHAGSVILLSAEDDPADTIRPRLEAAGADLRKVHVLDAVRRLKPGGETVLDQFSIASDLQALQDAVLSLSDVRLVVIDPISAYLGNTDSHVDSKSRGVLAPLASLAQTLRFAVIGILHLNKSNNKQAIYRSNGSIAFTAAARAVWCFAKNPDDEGQKLMLPVKMNLAPDQTGLSYSLRDEQAAGVRVVWGGPVSRSADSVLSPEDSEERSERLEAVDWLREHLSAGPVAANQLKKDANSAGLSWITVRRAQGLLGIKPAKNGMEGGWSWQLPTPKDAHQPPKMLTVFEGAPSPQVSIFGGPLVPKVADYSLDDDGLGATCNACSGRFRTVAGWLAHVAQGRCYQLAGGVQ